MSKKVECPKCGCKEAEEIVEEVDIGVGVQRFVVGYICPKCREFSICSGCGAPEGTACERWCNKD